MAPPVSSAHRRHRLLQAAAGTPSPAVAATALGHADPAQVWLRLHLETNMAVVDAKAAVAEPTAAGVWRPSAALAGGAAPVSRIAAAAAAATAKTIHAAAPPPPPTVDEQSYFFFSLLFPSPPSHWPEAMQFFRGPFIKVEDLSGLCRPLVHEWASAEQLPRLYAHGAAGACPFVPPRGLPAHLAGKPLSFPSDGGSRSTSSGSDRDDGADSEAGASSPVDATPAGSALPPTPHTPGASQLQPPGASPALMAAAPRASKRPAATHVAAADGYCECCRTRYRDGLEKHRKTPGHQAYAAEVRVEQEKKKEDAY
jgi:hypothetical protein